MTGDLYADATVYDILQTPGTAREVDVLEKIERCFLGSSGEREQRRSHGSQRGPDTVWFEPACGTGRYLRVAVGRGHKVVGCDVQASAIEYARRRMQHGKRGSPDHARLIVEDMASPLLARRVRHEIACLLKAIDRPRAHDRIDASTGSTAGSTRADAPTETDIPTEVDAATDRADLAFVLVNSFRHLMSDGGVLGHLRQMSRILRPGGLYVVGISLRPSAPGPVADGRARKSVDRSADGLEDAAYEEDVWEARRGLCRVQQVVNYLPPEHVGRPRREKVVSHLIIERPGGVEHRDHTYVLRTYTQEQWHDLRHRSGWTHLASLDAAGRPVAGGIPPYQLEVLRNDP